ncbi:Apolipoprotein N-acyltransferase [BD1-7 clade bacterium]|uniref:Apolipoprotein N-acyltransferase n=1 Tax=BD1-7 clade bacterium TaxID=2029982 RepID=A0A5S9P3T7_9GAMM|nr:Apolipoprotein N-acyltransferase [BD1-7 clade bacterium]CAA0098151.1 Apolipoprotein N-acyltransferase [BD1-7 clade bacterium]
MDTFFGISGRFQTPATLIFLILGAALATLSWAPFNLWPLALVTLVIFHQAIATASIKQVVWRSMLFGLVMNLSGIYWLYVSMHEHGGASPFLATLMVVGFCIFLAVVLFLPFVYLYARIWRDAPTGLTLGFAAMWVLNEWYRSWILTGFPWLYFGYTQTEAPLAPWAPVIGTFGLTFVLAFTAGVISQWISQIKHGRASKKALFSQTLIVALLWIAPFGLKQVEWVTRKDDTPVKVALIQPNLSLQEKWNPAMFQPILNYFRQTTEGLTDQDIVIWPETAIPRNYHRVTGYLDVIDTEGQASNTSVILGIPSKWRKDDRVVSHNSIISIGAGKGIYHKQKLVPFGEYVPLEDWIRGLIQFFDLPMSHFRPGPENQEMLKAGNIEIAPFICYEVVYPDLVSKAAERADIFLTVSNDAWFGESIGPLQHLQMAQMRALENGRYLLRGTNTGVTVVVGPDGKIIEQLPQFERGVLKTEVYAMKGLTPLARYGTLPVVLLSAFIAVILFLSKRSFARRPGDNANDPNTD